MRSEREKGGDHVQGDSKGRSPWRAFGDFPRGGKVTRGGGAERPPHGEECRGRGAAPPRIGERRGGGAPALGGCGGVAPTLGSAEGQRPSQGSYGSPPTPSAEIKTGGAAPSQMDSKGPLAKKRETCYNKKAVYNFLKKEKADSEGRTLCPEGRRPAFGRSRSA